MSSAEAVAEHVRRHYGTSGRIERVPKGRADSYCVDAISGRWLFKVFQPEYTLARIEGAANFLSFIVGCGYPAREFVRAADGARVLRFDERAAVLIPWIEGHTPASNTLSSAAAIEQLGALCGRIHRLGVTYRGPAALEYAGSRRALVDKRAALLRLVDAGGEIGAEARVRVDILNALGDELARNQARARPGVIHGDFSAAHVVFQADKAVGVIDVLGELYLPGWELMRAFFQSVPSASIDDIETSWRAYVGGYASAYRISPEEVEIAYDTYLLQLTSSTYGLRQPLDDQLRGFGRWRTTLARYLAAHRTEFRPLMASVLSAAP
jgi:Ser/Thr protein kinase RdoA (MazF antagonist)